MFFKLTPREVEIVLNRLQAIDKNDLTEDEKYLIKQLRSFNGEDTSEDED